MRTATLLTRIALSGSRVGCHQLVKPTRGNNVFGDICGHQQLASQRVLPFRIIARQQTTLGSETKEESMRKALLSALDASFVDIEDISGRFSASCFMYQRATLIATVVSILATL